MEKIIKPELLYKFMKSYMKKKNKILGTYILFRIPKI